LRSLRTRIALLVFAVAVGALLVVFLGVVPQLQSSLRREALDQLRREALRDAPAVARAIEDDAPVRRIDALVRDAADLAEARVTLLGVSLGDLGAGTYVRSDSTREVRIDLLRFDVGLAAARRGRVVVGTESGAQGLVGQVAVPLRYRDDTTGRDVVGSVLVFTRRLSGVEGQVAVIRRRFVVAGLGALLLAGLAGLLLARVLSGRVRGLEAAARRVAGGDFSARFPVGGDDELSQLGRTLEAMRRQLAELDEARSRFIATASHELRTPIFTLGGFLELLEEEDLPEADRRRFVVQVREQVARLERLARDLLDLSRLESGALSLRPERVDLRALVRTVAAEFGPALAAHGSTAELRLPAESLEVVCDADRVGQVLRILLDNAITHTPPGTDVVLLASRRDGVLRVGVGDFGPGITRAMLPHVFEPFVTSDDASGSGLGLAIAHELAERMDGRLAVESQPGRTTFTLELAA
jgi:two-component system, OmpR family, sensor kinase